MPANIRHLGDLGAVAVVIGIVEVVLDEAAPFLLGRGKDLRQDQFPRHGVAGRAGNPVLVLVGKRPVKARIPDRVNDEEVDGACYPRSVLVTENTPGYFNSLKAVGLH